VVIAGGLVIPPERAHAAPAACGESSDAPLTQTPWPLRRLRPELAWPLTTGTGVTVAVIDSGVSAAHPSLSGRVLPGKDYIQQGGAGDCDEVAHGTFVGGIIAGNRIKDSGFYGVAPGAKILPIRVLRDLSKSTDSTIPATIADAINYAVSSGAQVINLSLVTQKTAQLEAAVANALARNVVVVAAAGNEGAAAGSGDKTAYPAALPGVIGVAGVDESDHHVSTSTSGDYVDVAAPGIRIQGPAPQGGGFGERTEGGTSFAAPYVAGVAALIRAYDPGLSAAQIAERITSTADHPAGGRDNEVGYGVVNPARAVSALLGGSGALAASPGASALGSGTPAADPMREVLIASIWIAVGGFVLALLTLAGAGVARRIRSRSAAAGVPSGGAPVRVRSRDAFTPVVGKVFTVTGPNVNRPGGSEKQKALLSGRRPLPMPGVSGLGGGQR
jgi:type VII secretion-associated serine protease mycosin